MEDRRLVLPERKCEPPMGKKIEARLIAENNGSAFLQRPFLREGHFFSFQCSMASSSLWSALTFGLLQTQSLNLA